MQRHSLCCLLFVSVGLQFSFGESPGICVSTVSISKERHVLDRSTRTWKKQVYYEPREQIGCCEGYKSETLPLQCTPVCDPECENAVCEAPNTCECLPGHTTSNISNNTCYDICESCINGECLGSELECTCFDGYQPDKTLRHVCNPVCSHPCVNATCSAPNRCECFPQFEKDPKNNNVCIPICRNLCVFGNCTDPDECSCFDGYINDERLPHMCVPVCAQNCENGFCERPNSCKCFDGFQHHPRDPFKCFPRQPESSTLSFCELQLPKAVKYSRTSDCYTLKEVSVKSDSQCQPLDALLQPMCRQGKSCSFGPCVLNFRCSAKVINTSKEIHCDFESDDFETEESTNITITDNDDWLDAVLVLNFVQHVSSSNESLVTNQTHEWILRPASKWAVCGQNHFFALEVCGSSKIVSSSSKVFWIIGYYLLSLLLASCCGAAGWFYWTRHRRLNDPLNYRENVSRGFNNPGFQEQPSELLSMDGADEENIDL